MINLKTILSSFDDKETLLKWLKKVEKALAESVLEDVEVVTIDATHIKLVFKFEDETEIETSSIALPRGATGPQGPQGPMGLDGPAGKDALFVKEVLAEDTSDDEFYISSNSFNREPEPLYDAFFFFNNDGEVFSIVFCGVTSSSGGIEPVYTCEKIAVLNINDANSINGILEGSETIVVDLAEDGKHIEIHLDADVLAKIENSLQLPLTHTERKIVAVDTAGGQEMLGIGEGLSVAGGRLKVTSSGGTKLYKHGIYYKAPDDDYGMRLDVISNQEQPYVEFPTWEYTGIVSFSGYDERSGMPKSILAVCSVSQKFMEFDDFGTQTITFVDKPSAPFEEGTTFTDTVTEL